MSSIKDWLLEYRDAERASTILDERISALRARLESARTTHLDGLPKGGGFAGDQIGGSLAVLETLEAEAAEARQLAKALFNERNDAIKRIRCKFWPDLRLVLQLRYLDGERWENINAILWASKPNFDDQQESFLRRTFRLHNSALRELEKIIVLEEGQRTERKKKNESI